MIRGTTPQHRFLLPFAAESLAALRVSYAQRGEVLAERTLSECAVNENAITVTLTQEETLSFVAGERVQIQVRALTKEGKAHASRILRVSVSDCLCEEVLA